MKKYLFLVLALFVAACQNDSGGGNNNTTATTTATTPLTTNCLNGTTYCNNNLYGNTYGWMAYPGMYNYAYNYTNYFNQYGFNNCPYGYMPTYNNSYGLGCVNQQLIRPYSGFYTYWQWGTGMTGWGQMNSMYSAPQYPNNHAQISNVPNYYYNNSRNLVQSCILNQGNTCSNGATCRQVQPGSNLGICVGYY